ncbi:uncharacterized protein V1516DRAFT_666863 [Lipomyces oligophaga]|uniref:uncharacterized protein n=1 Tax=Lipomyces oligophaga TaxID=45792 RepID=UPI0034CFA6B5
MAAFRRTNSRRQASGSSNTAESSASSASSSNNRRSLATRVLSEITNSGLSSDQSASTTSNRSSKAALSPNFRRLSNSGQSRVSSAIQHFSRITTAASNSTRPAISKPLKVVRNGKSLSIDEEMNSRQSLESSRHSMAADRPRSSAPSQSFDETLNNDLEYDYEDDNDTPPEPPKHKYFRKSVIPDLTVPAPESNQTSLSRRVSTASQTTSVPGTAGLDDDASSANHCASDAFASASSGYCSSPPSSNTEDEFDSDRGGDTSNGNNKHISRLSSGTIGSTSSSGRRHKTHVGPWRLGRTLGRGSSGRVRLAKHSTTGKLAAVKIVPKSVSGYDDTAADPGESGKRGKDAAGLPYGIEREVIIMKLIEHPNVMGLYDVWENRGELYLILEYVEGGELFDYLIKKGRLEESEAVHYFRQIILGIDYCHKFNICHRDLKPENLLLDKYHNIKIADFGMAALEISSKMLETSCGSPHYASPEIVAGKKYHGSQSDIWSCGVILFALLTGHLPFDDDNIRNLLLKVQVGKFQMPQDLSIQAKDLIWRILKVDPEERITANEILTHPLLRKYPTKEPLHNHIRPVSMQVNNPIATKEEADMEIVKNLQTLWHGVDRDTIIARLLAPGANPEKTFYCLLMKYRHDHLDDMSPLDMSPIKPPRTSSLGANSELANAKIRSQSGSRQVSAQHSRTPSRTIKSHRKTSSRGSARSMGRKPKVVFSHSRRQSLQKSISSRSFGSGRRVTSQEDEPPLPSDLDIAAVIDRLAFDQSVRDFSNDADIGIAQERIVISPRYETTGTAPKQFQKNDTLAALETFGFELSSTNSTTASANSSRPATVDSAGPIAPVAPLHGSRRQVTDHGEFPVLSAKEQKLRQVAQIVGDEDDLRKISAEFAAMMCEKAFNFDELPSGRGNINARNISDSTTSSYDRTVSSSSARTTSTAMTSAGNTPVLPNGESGIFAVRKPSLEPLKLPFRSYDRFPSGNKVRDDGWVDEEFDSFFLHARATEKGRIRQASKSSLSREASSINLISAGLRFEGRADDAGNQRVPGNVPLVSLPVAEEVAEEDDAVISSFALELDRLWSTPKGVKRRSLLDDGIDIPISETVDLINNTSRPSTGHSRRDSYFSARESMIIESDARPPSIKSWFDDMQLQGSEERKVSAQSTASDATTIIHPKKENIRFADETDDVEDRVTVKRKSSISSTKSGSTTILRRGSSLRRPLTEDSRRRMSTAIDEDDSDTLSGGIVQRPSQDDHVIQNIILVQSHASKPMCSPTLGNTLEGRQPESQTSARKEAIRPYEDSIEEEIVEHVSERKWTRFRRSILITKPPAALNALTPRTSGNGREAALDALNGTRTKKAKKVKRQKSKLLSRKNNEDNVWTDVEVDKPRRNWFSKMLSNMR